MLRRTPRTVNLMPCFRCSSRQTDPVRGASPWHRVVVNGEQVLVCPTCRPAPEWDTVLDRCDRCASTRLAKALGTVLCRDCGARKEPTPASPLPAPEASGPPDGSGHLPLHQRPPSPRSPQLQTSRRPASATAQLHLLEPSTPPAANPPQPAAARPADVNPADSCVVDVSAAGAQKDKETTGEPRVDAPPPADRSAEPAARSSDLAADVDAALTRMFGRPRPVS
ncbi:hypothetical protein CC117_02270 [Parafrankia colletiae]|uniref:Uncharacterized protein n=1 Tax=Parafrankia colletiae TaxID=573497 RepID=A0A1S1RKZ9_9ACTN|nr:hypothetical protein CC117_02270 [Parafrankia colletiae]